MDQKIEKIKQTLSEKQRLKDPPPSDYKTRNGSGFHSGKQSESLPYRTILNKYTSFETEILPDDERVEQSGLLQKMKERDVLQRYVNSIIGKNKYNPDEDKTFLLDKDIPDTTNEIALSRSSFFKDYNSLNVVSGTQPQNSMYENFMKF